MIVDIHSHVWEDPAHFTAEFRRQAARARAGVDVDLTVSYEAYRASAPADERDLGQIRSRQLRQQAGRGEKSGALRPGQGLAHSGVGGDIGVAAPCVGAWVHGAL